MEKRPEGKPDPLKGHSFMDEKRARLWSRLTQGPDMGGGRWDILVIGGGITGAGILLEASRRGLSAALVEQRDFAWGTSSRTSKMVHGGLRYLMQGHWRLTRMSVKERDRLLQEAPGLVEPMGFLFADYRGRIPGRKSFEVLLTLYDLFSSHRTHRYYPAQEFNLLAPRIRSDGLKGGAMCVDAVTDDARLVLRLLNEARESGALALNYAAAETLLKAKGRVCGVAIRDVLTERTAEVHAKVVVNATGAWADRLRNQAGGGKDIRPLRGSHIIFPFWRLPVAQTVALMHPKDRRGVFILPWEGVTVVGSTDLDHKEDLDTEARITPGEVDYLLEVVHDQFPSLGIGSTDILSTYSGVRPVVAGGAPEPSKERRDHRIWVEEGLISVSGGKLTTFRVIALDVLRHAARLFPSISFHDAGEPLFPKAGRENITLRKLGYSLQRRISGRYGRDAVALADCARQGELSPIPGTHSLWAELRWAARNEDVVHLEDLLMRRTRLGLLLPEGGSALLDNLKGICQEEMGWDERRWQQESDAYRTLWHRCYSLPQ